MSLRTRILILFLVFTAFPLLFLGLGDYTQSVNALRITIEQRTLGTATVAARDVEGRALAARDSLGVLAAGLRSPADLEVVVGEPGSHRRAALAEVFESVALQDGSGLVLASAVFHASAPGCAGAAALPRPITVTAPWPGGPARNLQLVGTVAPLRLLGPVARLNAQLGREGHVLVVEPETRRVVYSAECGDIGRSVAAVLGAENPVTLHPGQAFRIDDAASPATAAAQVVGHTPWTLLATAADAEFITPFTDLRRNYLLLVFGLVVGAAGAAFILVRRSFLTLERLAAAADEVGHGNLTPWLPPPGEDEAGRLALAFGRMTHRLSQSMREAERSQKMAAVGALASYLSHEIRNPLSSIKLNLQSLARDARSGVVPEDLPRVVQLCLAEVERLNKVVFTVLELGRDQPPADGEIRCSAHDVVRNALDLLAPRLERAGVRVDTSLDAEPSSVRAEPDRLKGVLINLLVNACDVLPRGGTIRILTRRTVDADGTPQVCVHVADDGPGVPPHLREMIFEPFFTTKPEGNGIGLATAAATLREWGASIRFQKASETVPGAEFVLYLQAARQDAAEGMAGAPSDRRRRLRGRLLADPASAHAANARDPDSLVPAGPAADEGTL